MPKNGRPKIQIDWKRFEECCAAQCTLREIADYFNCSQMTIERKVKEHYHCGFVDIFKRRRQKGLMSLRVSLFKMAEKQPSVAIFLAKNWLGMSDKTEIAGPEGQPIMPPVLVFKMPDGVEFKPPGNDHKPEQEVSISGDGHKKA